MREKVFEYGTFDKAKYLLFRAGISYSIYAFTTTCRNGEECLEIMKDKIKEHRSCGKYFKVFKVQDGNKKLIFTNKPFDKP